MTNKLYIKTMGCQMNVYDSDKMADVLRESHGFELTQNAEEANLLLVKVTRRVVPTPNGAGVVH